ncbi:NB-ARC domain-containing protein, partial [Streptomyces sp. NPDC052079]|uniref:NB-ARC domain-containing protein n=1 Tax=Streptomyces sp. NPDC052079 TaxID=3155526 RepID=UPI0034315724
MSAAIAGSAVWLQERQPVGRDDPPPPPPPAVPGWFVDRAQTRGAVAAVCHGGSTVAITTSLVGAGGFGKTTLATAVCADRRVRRRFRTRIYFVTIGRDVRGRAEVAAKVAAVTRFITGDSTEFDDPDLAGAHLGRLLAQRPRTLLVLDDVWEPEQLAPFLHGGVRLVRLVTTRNPALIANGVRHIPVDDLSPAQARSLLTWQLPSLPDSVVDALLRATRRWALLVRLSNRVIAEQVATGADPADTADRLLRRLQEHGPAALDDASATWDLADPAQRNQAARASIEAATSLLPPGGSDRYMELGIFAEDESIPISLVAALWQATAGLSEGETRALCRSLERLSLLTLTPQRGGRISLHDVYRDYLRTTLGPARLAHLNRSFLDALAATLPAAPPLTATGPAPQRAWWQHPETYLLDNLIRHLLDADRTAAAEAVAGDIRWVETRLHQRGSSAPWSDLDRIDTPHTRPLAHSLAQAAHLLTPTTAPRVLTGILHSRLDHHPHWHPQIAARRHDPALHPSLTNQWPLPDNPHNALQRTLTGHTDWVRSVAIAPDGTWLATTSNDETVRS